MSTILQPELQAGADPLIIAGVAYHSRLLVGSGKYKDLEQTRLATEASGAEIITVAIRRTNIGQNAGEPNLLDVVPPNRYTILPNTAGCYTAEDAVRTCRLARELLDGHDLVKLEVLGDQKTLFPDILQTLQAAETLIADGFKVMVYTNDDPIIAKRFEDMGCVAVMPLAAPIGSGLGIRNPYNILTIVENAKVPILVDAGVGTASDAALAMELGCDGVLMNTAIAGAKDPVLMASAMKKAIDAGREAFLAGRIPRKRFASRLVPHRRYVFLENPRRRASVGASMPRLNSTRRPTEFDVVRNTTATCSQFRPPRRADDRRPAAGVAGAAAAIWSGPTAGTVGLANVLWSASRAVPGDWLRLRGGIAGDGREPAAG